jgi:hypothetical protein
VTGRGQERTRARDVGKDFRREYIGAGRSVEVSGRVYCARDDMGMVVWVFFGDIRGHFLFSWVVGTGLSSKEDDEVSKESFLVIRCLSLEILYRLVWSEFIEDLGCLVHVCSVVGIEGPWSDSCLSMSS